MIVVLRMAQDELSQLDDEVRILSRLGKRHVDVAVEEHRHSDLGREVEDAIERAVAQRRRLAGDLRRHELLVNRELADALEDAGEDA